MKDLSAAITVTRGADAPPAFQERVLVVASEGAVPRRACVLGLLHCQAWGILCRQPSDHVSYPVKMDVARAVLLRVGEVTAEQAGLEGVGGKRSCAQTWAVFCA